MPVTIQKDQGKKTARRKYEKKIQTFKVFPFSVCPGGRKHRIYPFERCRLWLNCPSSSRSKKASSIFSGILGNSLGYINTSHFVLLLVQGSDPYTKSLYQPDTTFTGGCKMKPPLPQESSTTKDRELALAF